MFELLSDPNNVNMLAMGLAMGSKLFNAPGSGADNLANLTIGMAGNQQKALQQKAMLQGMGLLGGAQNAGASAASMANTAAAAAPAAGTTYGQPGSNSLSLRSGSAVTDSAGQASEVGGLGYVPPTSVQEAPAGVQGAGLAAPINTNQLLRAMILGNTLGGGSAPFRWTPGY